MENMVTDGFYRSRRVFITGHTGFKGSWLVRMLLLLGADVTGYALAPPTQPNLHSLAGNAAHINSIQGDVRNYDALSKAILSAKPDVVFHMAAQPLVRESYRAPLFTYETNVMGTANLLECLRTAGRPVSFVNITTDKVYENREQQQGYNEQDRLGGFDPYSNSKACSELVTQSYRDSFFSGTGIVASTARSGNVIGGGDFALERIVPDCVRAALEQRPIELRNPASVRPYQHVLEALGAYLLIAQTQHSNTQLAGSYNIGPNDEDCVSTGRLATLFCTHWGGGQHWLSAAEDGPHETSFLRLNSTHFRNTFHWAPAWNIETAIQKTIEWTNAYAQSGDITAITDSQIKAYWENGGTHHVQEHG